MALRDLNWKKLVGKEEIQQGNWVVQTSDGSSHRIEIGVRTTLANFQLKIDVDGVRFRDETVWVNLGRLAEFEVGGDVFSVRQQGWGVLGQLVLSHNGRDIDKAESDAVPTPSEAAPSSDFWVTRIEEAERYSEPLGDEVRIIDNSRSKSSTERKITVSRQWSQSLSLDVERTTEIGGTVGGKIANLIDLSASAKHTIKRAYSISEEQVKTYSDEVTIRVNAETKSEVTFRWRQVWQRGVVVGTSRDGLTSRTPFAVKLHPTFDQAQEDIPTT